MTDVDLVARYLCLSVDVQGYGRSVWWQNVSIVQANRPTLRITNEVDVPEVISTAASRRARLATLPTVDGDFVQVLRSVLATTVS